MRNAIEWNHLKLIIYPGMVSLEICLLLFLKISFFNQEMAYNMYNSFRFSSDSVVDISSQSILDWQYFDLPAQKPFQNYI